MPAKARQTLEVPRAVQETTLGAAAKGAHGTVLKVGVPAGASALEPGELERRLLEIGFVEGARFEVVHEGLIGRDPIAVKLDDMTVALRRREAAAVLVVLDDEPDHAALNDDIGFAEAAE